ncbi:MAG: CYTH domain-containing protein [Pseudomonas neustonica]
MGKETEIKLRASADVLTALREHPLVKSRLVDDWQTGTLYNQYYDTENRDLAAAKVALRLRRDGDAIIQTLKSRGQSVAGLSERNEWDWNLQKLELDFTLLDDSCWPASLAELDKSALQPVFTTDFQRTRALLRWERDGEQVEIEAALDQGEVSAGDSVEPISELELEVRSGSPQALLELALELCRDQVLMPCDISKAERGYRLFDQSSYALRLDAPKWQPDSSVDAVIEGLITQLLGRVQRLAEQYRFARQWKLFREMTTNLAALRACFGVFDLALPRSSAQPFIVPLDQLLERFQPLVLAGWADDVEGEAARKQASEVFDQQLADPAWGQLFVELALWLLDKRWQTKRPPRGDRIAALPLSRWMLGAVGKEIQELRVPHHNDTDHQVHEWLDQLPRLGRLQLMLGNFRSFLDVSEPDRLFGELNKLHALLEQYPQIDDEQRELLLAALRKQGQRVRKLNAWRELNQ